MTVIDFLMVQFSWSNDSFEEETIGRTSDGFMGSNYCKEKNLHFNIFEKIVFYNRQSTATFREKEARASVLDGTIFLLF